MNDEAGRRRTTPRWMLVVWITWITGFLIGTTSHVLDLVGGGTQVYEGFHPAIRVFWISLTVLDPTVVTLLLLRLRVGVALGVAIILADISVNWSVFASGGDTALFGPINQSLFAVLLLITARPLWRSFVRFVSSHLPATVR